MAKGRQKKTRKAKIEKAVLSRAREWALKNGVKGDLSISTPTQEVWGWWVDILGSGEKDRVAHARFDLAGNPTMWEKHL